MGNIYDFLFGFDVHCMDFEGGVDVEETLATEVYGEIGPLFCHYYNI